MYCDGGPSQDDQIIRVTWGGHKSTCGRLYSFQLKEKEEESLTLIRLRLFLVRGTKLHFWSPLPIRLYLTDYGSFESGSSVSRQIWQHKNNSRTGFVLCSRPYCELSLTLPSAWTHWRALLFELVLALMPATKGQEKRVVRHENWDFAIHIAGGHMWSVGRTEGSETAVSSECGIKSR